MAEVVITNGQVYPLPPLYAWFLVFHSKYSTAWPYQEYNGHPIRIYWSSNKNILVIQNKYIGHPNIHLVNHAKNIMVSPARFEQVVRLLQHFGQLLCPNESVAAITVKVTVIIVVIVVIVIVIIIITINTTCYQTSLSSWEPCWPSFNGGWE